jgi:hypothetical protein
MGSRLALLLAKISFLLRDPNRFNKHGREHRNAPLVDVVLQIVATPSGGTFRLLYLKFTS